MNHRSKNMVLKAVDKDYVELSTAVRFLQIVNYNVLYFFKHSGLRYATDF